jgi:hypothetical protein
MGRLIRAIGKDLAAMLREVRDIASPCEGMRMKGIIPLHSADRREPKAEPTDDGATAKDRNTDRAQVKPEIGEARPR